VPGAPRAEQAVSTGQALATELRRMLTDRDGGGEDALRGLRALRDPALAPLFSRLARGRLPTLRGPAILALTELRPEAGLDLLLVRELGPRAKAEVVELAVQSGLVPPVQLRDLSRLPESEIPPRLYVLIQCRLEGLGERCESGRLAGIAAANDPVPAALATLLLGGLGDDTAPRQPLERLLDEAASSGGQQRLREVLTLVRSARLKSAAPFARRVLERFPDDRLLGFEAVSTLLIIDDDAARVGGLWQVQFGRAEDEGGRQRLALAALDAADQRPESVTAEMLGTLADQTSPLLRATGRVLEAFRGQAAAQPQGDAAAPVLQAMLALAEMSHAPTLAWLLRWAAHRPGEQADRVRLAIVERWAGSTTEGLAPAAVLAASELASSRPALLEPVLAAAIKAGDERSAESVLRGVLDRRPAEQGDGEAAALADLPAKLLGAGGRWPGATTEALAAVIRVRLSRQPDAEAVAQVERVALGLGQLAPAARAQAAWLALRQTQQDRSALARLLAEIGA
jgi:hypothetical protein